MKALFLSFALLFSGLAASAASCTDFRGAYKELDAKLTVNHLKIEQQGCSVLTLYFKKVYDSGTEQSWTQKMEADGVQKEVAPGLLRVCSFKGHALQWLDTVVGDGSQQRGVMYFVANGDLVMVGDSFPSGVVTKVTYRKASVE